MHSLLIFLTLLGWLQGGICVPATMEDSRQLHLLLNPGIVADNTIKISGIFYSLSSKDFPNQYLSDETPLSGRALLRLTPRQNNSDSQILNQIIELSKESGQVGVEPEILFQRLVLFKGKDADDRRFTIAVSTSSLNGDSLSMMKMGENRLVVNGSQNTQEVQLEIQTDDQGFFQTRIPIRAADDRSTSTGELTLPSLQKSNSGPVPSFRVQIRFGMSDEQSIIAENRAFFLQTAGLAFVSDIDDTIKVSNITGGASAVVDAALFQPYIQVPGMAELYNKWSSSLPSIFRRGGKESLFPSNRNSFHYVSGCGWQLEPAYSNQFLNKFQFPNGTLHFKTEFIGTTDIMQEPNRDDGVFAPVNGKSVIINNTLLSDFVPKEARESKTFKHKTTRIGKLIITTPSTRSFVLVGDSTEYDPEVYAYLVRQFGWSSSQGRIQCVYIREVDRIKKDSDDGQSRLSRWLKSLKTTLGLQPDAQIFGVEKEMLDETRTQVPLKQRLESLFRDLPEVEKRVVVFREGSDLMSADLANGHCR